MAVDIDLEDALEEAERELVQARKHVNELRGQASQRPVEDYTFQDTTGPVNLSDLFGARQDLLVIHNMGKSCPYCTLWADGFIGLYPHLNNRAAFAMVSPDDPQTQKEFGDSRGWPFRMVSSQGSTFSKDMGYESPEGKYHPGVSAFRKDEDGSIRRISSAPFGPGDEFCGIWHFFDLFEDGANEWQPKYTYD